jgi:GTP1/Obg family GTP-binding protein
MSKSKSTRAKTTLERIKSLPWAAALQVGMVLRSRWRRLSEKDREHLVGLMRQSRGRVSNLSHREREELRRLVGKADLKGVVRDLLSLRSSRRGRRRR